MEITKIFPCVETAHRLKDHPGKCQNIHGHNYRIEVTFAGPIQESGMVKDFADIKEIVGGYIGHMLDHALVLQDDDPLLPLLQEIKDENIEGLSFLKICIMTTPPTAENMAHMIGVKFITHKCVRVKIWETPTSFAEWRYGG